ncbi:putative holin-like toxin, partial [Streptococcus suis]
QLIRSDLECEARTNLPINHCAEMLTRIKRSGMELFVLLCKSSKSNRKEKLSLSTFEVLTLMFVAGNFVIALVMLVLELVKSTKK